MCVFVCSCVYVCVCVCVCVCVFCVCVCLCVYVCNRFLFLFLYIQAAICFAHNRYPNSPLHWSFFLLYVDASVAPSILRLLLVTPSCRCPPSPPIVLTDCHPPVYLASGSLASGDLSPAIAPAVLSLPHLLYPISGGFTYPCPWCLGREGCWTSLLLVIYEPLQSHTSPNISASNYY